MISRVYLPQAAPKATRVYVAPKIKDKRGDLYKKSFNSLGFPRRVSEVCLIDSYLISHELNSPDLEKAASALTNSVLEESSINKFPKKFKKPARRGGFTYAIEIGFLPGVTDNVGHTVKETIADLLHIKKNDQAPNPNDQLKVYSSKIFLISGSIKLEDAKKISLSLHNPLIESSHIASFEKVIKQDGLPKTIPEVVLRKLISVIEVPILDAADDELARIGSVGILDPETKTRRGPLALSLKYMKSIQAHFKKLGRNPTDIELESLAQTWSEHCKHTIFANPIDNIKDGLYKTYIKAATNEIRRKKGKADFCISVFSDNSGGIAFDDEWMVTHKVETHNSPSALDPFGGAITGIVGVNRDTLGFGLGAKPVANTYGFCFSYPDDERKLFKDKNLFQKMLHPRRIIDGVIKGINSGGNCSGIPTLNGFMKFDMRYRAKPLVFAGTVGLIPRKINDRFSHEKKAQAGDYIVVIGGRVGLDGIHGATFSSVGMDANSPATAVQIGDPITQKKFSDAIVREARAMNLYSSITDNGAGGISCSVAEMAKECGGGEVDLGRVPLKYPNLRPWEIWISESQERMTLSVPKKKWEVFRNLMQSRGVEATVIGEFTDSGNCVVNWGGRNIVNMTLEFLHYGLPKDELKTEKIASKSKEIKFGKKSSYTKDLENLLGNINLGGFAFVSEQYDHEVQAGSVLKPLSGRGRINTEAQIFRPVLDSDKGVLLSSSLYPSYGDINTYHMTASAIDTAVRNIVAAGGSLKHLAILDNFCWSLSADKTRLYELVESLKACYKYATGYGTPFISGKDSMWNDFKGFDQKGNPVAISVPPTLLISAIGVMDDYSKAVSPEFKNEGDLVYLLGETFDELGGGEYLTTLNMKGGEVPKVDVEKNRKIYEKLEKVIERNILSSSLSITSGGLGMALAKAAIGGMLGVEVNIAKVGLWQTGKSPTLAIPIESKLFSESQGRILVSVSPRKRKTFEKTVKDIPYVRLGEIKSDGKFVIMDGEKKIVETKVKKLHDLYHSFSNKMR